MDDLASFAMFGKACKYAEKLTRELIRSSGPTVRDERDHPIEVVVDHVYEVLSGREDAFNYYTLP